MDLLPSADQEEIVAQTRAFLDDRLPATRLCREGASGAGQEAAAWREMAQQGWFGVALPEDAGGVGLALADEMLVFRELGRHLVSPTVLATALAARLALAAGEGALAQRLVAGEAIVAPVVPSRTRTASGGHEVMVLDGGDASHLLLWDGDGASLFPRAAAAALQSRPGFDAHLPLQRGSLAGTPLLSLPAATFALHAVATVLCSAMLVGIAEATCDMATGHARTREQFGKRIGEFQAVKHACADMRVRSEVAFWQVAVAALAHQRQQPDASLQRAAAKVLAADAAIRNAAACIQLHGGMGFTAELGADAFLRRAHALHHLGGDSRTQRTALLAIDSPA